LDYDFDSSTEISRHSSGGIGDAGVTSLNQDLRGPPSPLRRAAVASNKLSVGPVQLAEPLKSTGDFDRLREGSLEAAFASAETITAYRAPPSRQFLVCWSSPAATCGR
jgi:hypothetical protein